MKKIHVEDGGKYVIDKRLTLVVSFIVFGAIAGVVSINKVFLEEAQDTSSIETSDKLEQSNANTGQGQSSAQEKVNLGGVQSSYNQATTPRVQSIAKPKINYRAKQVLSVGGVNGGKTLPLGVSLVGRLLNSIDTRSKGQRIKVLLPYGGKHEGSGGSLPPNTIIFGTPRYSGRGNKIQINFNQGLLPDGQEVSLQAQALSPKDYSIGIEGEFHGNTGGRTAGLLGLTMIAGVSETLVKKEALGQGFNVTAKASLKNGLYNGLSKVANLEVQRSAAKAMNEEEYLTVEAGKGLIISLTGNYKEKNE